MSTKVKPPTDAELKTALGSANILWSRIVRAVEAMRVPLDKEWRPSKAGFGRICLLRHKQRTLLYLTPDKGKVWIAIVLGERAYGLAMASSIPAAIKKMLADAKPYAEGRGIRYSVSSLSDVSTIKTLLELKLTPK